MGTLLGKQAHAICDQLTNGIDPLGFKQIIAADNPVIPTFTDASRQLATIGTLRFRIVEQDTNQQSPGFAQRIIADS